MSRDIYSEIRALIANGTYIGGDTLPESELASRLGVSRTPVREAMRRLQSEGVIRREAYRRAIVVDTDPNEVFHIFTARAALEPVAVDLAIQKVDDAFLERLRDLHDRMDNAIGSSEPDRRAYRDLNALFHRTIWAQTGNALLMDTIHSVARKPLVRPTFNHWEVRELRRSNSQHGDMVEAFAARDTEWAQATMRVHLLSSRAAYRRIGSLQAE